MQTVGSGMAVQTVADVLYGWPRRGLSKPPCLAHEPGPIGEYIRVAMMTMMSGREMYGRPA